jgi:NAD(P)-dependent dehydrogenase (short-subunit alcohol dehydrogenase family)/acyl carrier protein
LNELRTRGFVPRSILHLWSAPDGGHSETQNGQTAFDNLVHLAQAFGDSHQHKSVDWVVVTSGLHSVTGRENLDPQQSLVLGPLKVIPREYPNIACRAIDVIPVSEAGSEGENDQRDLIENLLLEPAMPRPWRAVAYRDGYRWEHTFESVRLPARTKSNVRENGVYLITGGMGGIGLTIAAHLAEQGRARLAFTSRSAIPERSEWQRWIKEHGEDDSVSRKIRGIEKLESLGAEVLPLAANVSDREEMQRALDAIHARFGPIDGVIHAAGIPGGGLVQLKTPEATRNVLSPKVAGTLVLDSLLNIASLDFFVLCSSIDAISPVAGAVDYCAANSFLDAYAAARQAKGHKGVVSINWDTWQEVGMAENVEVPRDMKEQRRAFLESAIRPTEGVEAFRRVLSARLPQVAVITHDLPQLIKEMANRSKSASDSTGDFMGFVEGMPRQAAEGSHSRPDLANAFIVPETDIQNRLVEIWSEVLGIRKIGIDDNFFEMGGHSLLATGVLSRIRNSFGVSVPLRTIFETPTIRQLSSHLETLLWVVSRKSTATDASEEREEIEI